MREAIKNFHKQFEWAPVVENAGKLKKFKPGRSSKFIIAGMGGSNLVGGLLKIRNPKLDIISRRDYGLPPLNSKEAKETLIIASSYSGNTEETISSFHGALKKKYAVAAITTGGKLLNLAKRNKKPYVVMPFTGVQPRMALGYSSKAIAKLIGDRAALRELKQTAELLKPYELERAGKALARKLKGDVPIIYSSEKNLPIAYNWKIKFNETGKVPAFVNYFPELNHNEMTGFDVKDTTRELSKNFYFIFLKDINDNQRIAKRMNITERLYRERGLSVEAVMINGKTPFHKIFSSIIYADWTAYYIAHEYGVEAEQVPMVEEFKKLIR